MRKRKYEFRFCGHQDRVFYRQRLLYIYSRGRVWRYPSTTCRAIELRIVKLQDRGPWLLDVRELDEFIESRKVYT